MTTLRTITLADLAAHHAAGHLPHLWNVLTDDYFAGDMIPGSRRVPLDTVGREVARLGLPRDAAIVVYCAGPSCPQSRMAAEKLAALGFTNVSAFEGGIEEWAASGRPLDHLVQPVGAAS